METIDEEFLKSTMDFIDDAVRDRKPFFVWKAPAFRSRDWIGLLRLFGMR
jgi:hypothetical protein